MLQCNWSETERFTKHCPALHYFAFMALLCFCKGVQTSEHVKGWSVLPYTLLTLIFYVCFYRLSVTQFHLQGTPLLCGASRFGSSARGAGRFGPSGGAIKVRRRGGRTGASHGCLQPFGPLPPQTAFRGRFWKPQWQHSHLLLVFN